MNENKKVALTLKALNEWVQQHRQINDGAYDSNADYLSAGSEACCSGDNLTCT